MLNLLEFTLEPCNDRSVKASINISSSLSYFLFLLFSQYTCLGPGTAFSCHVCLVFNLGTSPQPSFVFYDIDVFEEYSSLLLLYFIHCF